MDSHVGTAALGCPSERSSPKVSSCPSLRPTSAAGLRPAGQPRAAVPTLVLQADKDSPVSDAKARDTAPTRTPVLCEQDCLRRTGLFRPALLRGPQHLIEGSPSATTWSRRARSVDSKFYVHDAPLIAYHESRPVDADLARLPSSLTRRSEDHMYVVRHDDYLQQCQSSSHCREGSTRARHRERCPGEVSPIGLTSASQKHDEPSVLSGSSTQRCI